MNFTCYSKDLNGLYLSANPEFLAFTLLRDINDILGKNDHDMPWGRSANQIMRNDTKVITSGTSQVFIEQPIINSKPFVRRCFKSPLLGHNGKILGLSGLSHTIEKQFMIDLTPQQNACLKELAKGLSNKSIAKELGLSPRTVEHYLNAVKIKLQCESRSDLILHAITRGLVNSPMSPLG